MSTFEEFKKKALSNKQVAKEYQNLEFEFEFISKMLEARKHTGLSQELVAQKMGTKKPAISRLESGSISPSIDTLHRYAEAINCDLKIDFIPKDIPDNSLYLDHN